MKFTFKCLKCKKIFEGNVSSEAMTKLCPFCGSEAEKQFHACTNIYVPSYFHTSRSDIFSDTEWQNLKKNPDIKRI